MGECLQHRISQGSKLASPITIVLTFDVILVIMLTAYGVTTSGFSDITTTIAQITAPWPTVKTLICQSTDLSCNLARIGDFIYLFFLAFGSLLFRIGAIFYLIFQLVTVISLITSIPIIGGFFILFQIFLGIWAWSLIRQGSSGL